MIFKQFFQSKHIFRSKHQSPNPQVRIQAIENLDKQDPEQKSILHELAFNDSDVNVSLAALDKLDSFVLWYKMAEIAKNERVQKRSQKVIEQVLLSGDNQTLDNAEKRKFVLECRDNKLLEKLLLQPWVQADTELAMQLLQRLNKPLLQEKLLLANASESLSLAILSTLEDGPQQRKLLNRVLKKACPDTVKQQAKQSLELWLEAETKPIEIEQQVKMLLSRLLALKEHSDYVHVQQQEQVLVQEYQTLSQQFDCLSEVRKQQLEEKYADILAKVARTIALLKPQWEAAQVEQKLAADVLVCIEKTQSLLETLSAKFEQGVAEISPSDVEQLAQQIQQQNQALLLMINQVPDSNNEQHKKLESLHQALLARERTLVKLPEFQAAVQLGIKMIEKFEALALPTDYSQVDAARDFATELKQQWRNEVANYQELIPKSLLERWRNRITEWQQAVKMIQTKINEDLSRCRNKIRATQNLINQGKYKAAMGLYQKVQVWYQALPEKPQSQLERAFSDVKQEVENLQDWQEYIAAPRKPALLSEVEAIVAQPLAIDEQAKAVKNFRAQWNSLGKLDTESDQALNQAFDQAIEQAFAPCREHYQQQEQAREANLTAKKQIIRQLEELTESQPAVAELAKVIRQLQQKWANIGKVDYKQQSDLYAQYQAQLRPLKDKVNAFYLDNQEQKYKLVDKANKLAELDSIDDAIEQVKQLQAQWKNIEHAGRKAESQLWTAFKQANDNIFAKRTEASKAAKKEVQGQVELAKNLLDDMRQSVDKAQDKAEIANALAAKPDLDTLLQDLPHGIRKGLEQSLQTLLQLQQDKLVNLKQQEKSQQFLALFEVLNNWHLDADAEINISEQIKALAKPWQQCFAQLDQSVERHVDRHKVTIQMEIIAQAETPKTDASLRQKIQMELMALKLESGEQQSLTELLKKWISAGPLQEGEQALLARIQPLFVSH